VFADKCRETPVGSAASEASIDLDIRGDRLKGLKEKDSIITITCQKEGSHYPDHLGDTERREGRSSTIA